MLKYGTASAAAESVPSPQPVLTSNLPNSSFPIARQKLTTLPPTPEPCDWSAVSINTDLYLGAIRSSVSGLMSRFQEELKRLYAKGESAGHGCFERGAATKYCILSFLAPK